MTTAEDQSLKNQEPTPSKGQAPLDFNKLTIEKTTNPKKLLPNDDLRFGKSFTDHMLTIKWSEEAGWEAPAITPYKNLSLDPSAIVFHYAFECFEGLKAYVDKDDNVRIFRPDRNITRMNKSADRICLPTFDEDTMLKLISEFVKLEKRFIPKGRGFSLYLRPTLIGTDSCLGVHHPTQALFYLIASPVGPYYPTGFKAVRLEATDYATRAWPGGTGDKKLGANYAPCIKPQREAASRGYQQNLWLFGPEGKVTEVGTMNVFFVFKDSATGKKELVTAPLDGTILEGVTRESIVALAREKLDPKEWTVSERYCTIGEIIERSKKDELVEAFGSGTAAVVSPIKEIGYHDEQINVPLQPGKQTGPLTEQVAAWISEIQYGEISHPWSFVISS